MSDRVAYPFNCAHCGERFMATRHGKRTARFCSKSCGWAATKGPDYNARIARASAQVRGDAQRGKGTKGYVKRGGRHEHRAVAEAMLGRPLLPSEVVHHIDENKHNNAPENLVVLSRLAHMNEHGIGIKGQKLPWEPWKYRRTKP